MFRLLFDDKYQVLSSALAPPSGQVHIFLQNSQVVFTFYFKSIHFVFRYKTEQMVMNISFTQRIYKHSVLFVLVLCFCILKAVFLRLVRLGGIRNLVAFDPNATLNLASVTQMKKNLQMLVIKCLMSSLVIVCLVMQGVLNLGAA